MKWGVESGPKAKPPILDVWILMLRKLGQETLRNQTSRLPHPRVPITRFCVGFVCEDALFRLVFAKGSVPPFPQT